MHYRYDQKTIFVLGLPRSGTTWLAKILDSHPEVLYRHEPDIVRRNSDIPSLCPIIDADGFIHQAQAWLNTLAETSCLRTIGPPPIFPKSYHSQIERMLRQGIIAFLKVAGRVPSFGTLSDDIRIPDLIDLNAEACRRLVMTSVSTMGRTGLLTRAAPGSRFILVLRHPWGQIESILRGSSRGQNTGTDPRIGDTIQARRRNLTPDKIKALPQIAQLAWRWVIANETAMEELHDAAHCQVVRLFELNHDPMRHLPGLFDFCGLSWTEQASKFIAWSTQGSGSEGYYNMKRDPTQATWGWRKRLTQCQIDAITEIVYDSVPGRMFEVEPPPGTEE